MDTLDNKVEIKRKEYIAAKAFINDGLLENREKINTKEDPIDFTYITFSLWNIVSLRTIMSSGALQDYILSRPGIFILGLNEVKLRDQEEVDKYTELLKKFGFREVGINYSRSCKSYAGTAILSKFIPKAIYFGMSHLIPEYIVFDTEGRVTTFEYRRFIVICIYAVNSQADLKRQAFRDAFDSAIRTYVTELKKRGKCIIIMGDLNVAHRNIDFWEFANEKERELYKNVAGLSQFERKNFQKLLDMDFIDTFREKNPNIKEYTYWTNNEARQQNKGWRIDYILISSEYKDCIYNVMCNTDIKGSDHCPIELAINYDILKDIQKKIASNSDTISSKSNETVSTQGTSTENTSSSTL